MTKDDIIKAAFKVWGQELYQTTSLSNIARELGVSKPALYRHFKDKDALLAAMYTTFFDDYSASIRESYEQALSVGENAGSENAGKKRKSNLIMMRAIAEYYIRNRDIFVFSLVLVNNRQEKEKAGNELRKRGIDMRRMVYGEIASSFYPSKIQLIVTSLVFLIANFHRYDLKPDETPSGELVKSVLAQIEDRVTRGLGLDKRTVAALDYEGLEKMASGTVYKETEDNALLRAVAEVVAESGPWNASMEKVARRSGLSKSGLYAHFKSKQEMLSKLFTTEFITIVNFAKAQIKKSTVPEEQLYLAIVSIVNYLRSRPEILLAIDWIKTRRLHLGEDAVYNQLYRIIKGLKLETVQKQDQSLLVRIAQWILFMIVNTLAWWLPEEGDTSCGAQNKDWAKNIAEIPNESFRIMFRFIAVGLEGLNT